MWTLANLERASLQLLRRPETRVVAGSLDARSKEAHSTFDRRGNHNLYIKVDVAQVGLVDGVVHELLHAILRDNMSLYDSDCEEAIILGLEGLIVRRINKSPYKMKVWRNAITVKMDEK